MSNEPTRSSVPGSGVLITGGSSGLGRATAVRFAEEGAAVVVADLLDGPGEETVAQIEQLGGRAVFVSVDVTSRADTDAMARKVANTAFAAGYDQKLPRELQKFLVLPFAHSEDLVDQERSVALARRIGPDDLAHAEHHRDIVRRFGRFPHRNAIFGRESTPEEKHYLDSGGYSG